MKSKVPRKPRTKSFDEKQLEQLLRDASSLQTSRSRKAVSGAAAPAGELPAAKEKPRSFPRPKKDRSPAREEIELRAYHLYLQRGANHGLDWEDWFQAEGELRTKQPEAR